MKRLIVDMPSIMWYCLYAGKDEEHGKKVEVNGKTVLVNSAQHGYENFINSLVNAWDSLGIAPKDTILVVESEGSKNKRTRILESYKSGRDSNRPPEYYDEFNKLKGTLISVLRNLGVTSVTRPFLEADDVIAYLVAHLQGEKIIMSQDKDLGTCISDTTSLWRNATLETENPYGPWDVRFNTVYKALVGDSSDKIPGAKGFGDKAWLDLVCLFGDEGLEAMEELILTAQLDRLAEDVAEFKPLQKVIDNQDMVYTSYAAGKLYPEDCTNYRVPLEWLPGHTTQRENIHDERLVKYAGQIRLVSRKNYTEVINFIKGRIHLSDYVSLDIETSMCSDAIEWLMDVKKTEDEDKLGVDTLGSVLNGLSITFGSNNQYTTYFTCGHKDSDNLTTNEILEAVKLIPRGMPIVVHNSGFEQPVLYTTWGDQWKDNGWHGFLPNVHDTMILANYVDENLPVGLKYLSKHYLDYTQTTYEEVTQGRRMDEMTADEVLAYGADDTIMTAALYNHFRMICELEGSWQAYLDVEVVPAYVTALAYVQGVGFDREALAAMVDEDTREADRLQRVVDNFLTERGWEGTTLPVFTDEDLAVPAKIKEIFKLVTGATLKTMVRTPDKLFKLIASAPPPAEEDAVDPESYEGECVTLAQWMVEGKVDQINNLVASRFDGKPQFDINSPKQMQHLLYHVLNLKVRIVNNLTEKQRADNPDLAYAVSKFNKILRGSASTLPLTVEEEELLKLKASTDDTAIKFALKFDELEPEVREFLEALLNLKTITTRFNLFYNKYQRLAHWKDKRLHPSVRLTNTVTRRATSSGPNLQQMSKQGDGVKVRRMVRPHCENGVIVSIDFNGQELRLGAELSQDEAMLACYIGDNLKDMHAQAASGAMVNSWGLDKVEELSEVYGVPMDRPYELFMRVLKSSDPDHAKMAADLRKLSKGVVFGSQYDGQAPTLSKVLIIDVAEAQMFLDAKYAGFPRFEVWKEEVKTKLHRNGYISTLLGGRRHLGDALRSTNKWDIAKAERQGPNFAIQGGSAEQTKLAMASLWKSGALHKFNAQFIAPIHDELVCSVHRDDALEFIKVMHECMVQKYLETVPTLASISVGPNFADQIECGDEYDANLIQQALDQIFADEETLAA